MKPLELSGDDQVLTEDGGLVKRVIRPGIEGVRPKVGQEVIVHYEGFKEDGSVFDSSYERKEAFLFSAGMKTVIRGWDVALGGMNLAEKAELRVRSDYAFGEAGSAPEIQGGETLRFVIELVGLTPRGGMTTTKLPEGFVMQRSFPEEDQAQDCHL